MKNLFCIRHAKTQGNLEKRYTGTTDEYLSSEGIEELLLHLHQGRYPAVDMVFTSPMKRCIQTAQLIYGDREARVIPALRECAFGVFENKTYEELKNDPLYRAWIDSNGSGAIPCGEKGREFRRRCREAFEVIVREMEAEGARRAAVVAHGGTFMAIMEAYGPEGWDFFQGQMGYGEVRELTMDGR